MLIYNLFMKPSRRERLNQDNLLFRELYVSLPTETRTELRERFLEVSEMCYTTFYQKTTKTYFNRLELEALKRIIGDMGLNTNKSDE